MRQLPRDPRFDSTLAFRAQGYQFITNGGRELQSDASLTQLMLRQVVCATGEEAARMFYAPGRFTRRGAIPPTALRLLQDKGSVATLDGDAHRRRKAMFLSLSRQRRPPAESSEPSSRSSSHDFH